MTKVFTDSLKKSKFKSSGPIVTSIEVLTLKNLSPIETNPTSPNPASNQVSHLQCKNKLFTTT